MLFFLAAAAAPGQANYDEAKVVPYTLPDPLVFASGAKVRSAADWTKRRAEILRLFESEVYGKTPAQKVKVSTELRSIEKAFGGNATRKQVTFTFGDSKTGPRMEMLLYLPESAKKPVPVFLSLNFSGNHEVSADPGIRLPETWVRDPKTKTYSKVQAGEKDRGKGASRWAIDNILGRGYALATIYYQDIEPDFDGGMKDGVRALMPHPEAWGALGAWAWGVSRAVDFLGTDPAIDARKIALMGHSRLGKSALWAGAQDQRIAIVISNNSGEDIARINSNFPHSFGPEYKKYSGDPAKLPIDQHMLLALIAPRPPYVAQEDPWADPRGEFISAVAASPVYELLGKKGLGTGAMPGIHQRVGVTVGYHIADQHFGRKR